MEGKKYPSPERSGAKSLLISLREFDSREIQRGSDAIRGVPSLESRVGRVHCLMFIRVGSELLASRRAVCGET